MTGVEHMATSAADPQGQEGHSLTRAGEDYLESIYRLSLESAEGDKSVRSVDVAEQLVNKALSQLKEMGMVVQSRYGRVVLTEEGEAYAKVVWRSHRALRTFLEHDLGVKPEIADEEACLMEHVLSGDTMQRLIGYLERQGVEIPKE